MVAYKFVLTYSIESRLLAKRAQSSLFQSRLWASHSLARVASVSVRFMNKERGTRVKLTARKMEEVKERGGGGFPSSPPLSLPLFHFLALVSFLARSKPKIPFLGLSLLRNQTETLATQASVGCLGGTEGKTWMESIIRKSQYTVSSFINYLQKPIAPQRPQSFHWLLTVATAC